MQRLLLQEHYACYNVLLRTLRPTKTKLSSIFVPITSSSAKVDIEADIDMYVYIASMPRARYIRITTPGGCIMVILHDRGTIKISVDAGVALFCFGNVPLL